MSMLVFMLTDPNVNKDLLMKVCLVHDLAEAEVGDITPFAGISKEDKKIMEEVLFVILFMLKLLIDLVYCIECFTKDC